MKLLTYNRVSLFLLFFLTLFFYFLNIGLYILLPIFIYIIITFWGVFFIRSPLFFRGIYRIPTSEPVVFLTFDDGPDPVNTPFLIELSRKYSIKYNFFFCGKNIEKYRDIAISVVKDGHDIYNHSYSHSPFINFYSYKKLSEDIKQSEQIIDFIYKKAGRRHLLRLYRPPVGLKNPILGNFLKKEEFIPVFWTKHSGDIQKKNILKSVFNRLNNISSGDIILFHDNAMNMSKNINLEKYMEQILLFIIKRGLKPALFSDFKEDIIKFKLT